MMSRLLFKQNHSAKKTREIGGSRVVPNSRKAFASDRALDSMHRADQAPMIKHKDRRPRFLLAEQGMLTHFSVDACDVTDLRRRVIAACGNSMLFMRIQPLHHASQMRVWIMLRKQDFALVSRAIKSDMPQAELSGAV
jgi:hypothetical protein